MHPTTSSPVEAHVHPPLRFAPIAFSYAHPPRPQSHSHRSADHAHASLRQARLRDIDADSEDDADEEASRSGKTDPERSTMITPIGTSAGKASLAATGAEALYRGSYPRPRHFNFLSSLGIRTIVSCTPKSFDAYANEEREELEEEDEADSKQQQGKSKEIRKGPSEMLVEWCAKNHVRTIHVKCEKVKEVESIGISAVGMLQVIRATLTTSNHPVYLHDLDGQSIIPLALAILRKLQAWSYSSIDSELMRTLREVPSEGTIPREVRDFVRGWGESGIVLPLSAEEVSAAMKARGPEQGRNTPEEKDSTTQVYVRLPRRSKLPTWLWPNTLAPHAHSHAAASSSGTRARSAATASAPSATSVSMSNGNSARQARERPTSASSGSSSSQMVPSGAVEDFKDSSTSTPSASSYAMLNTTSSTLPSALKDTNPTAGSSASATTLSILRDPWNWFNLESHFLAWWDEFGSMRVRDAGGMASNGSAGSDEGEPDAESGHSGRYDSVLPTRSNTQASGLSVSSVSTSSSSATSTHHPTSAPAWTHADVSYFLAQASARGTLPLPITHPHIAKLGFDPEPIQWFLDNPPHYSHHLSEKHHFHHHSHHHHHHGYGQHSSATTGSSSARSSTNNRAFLKRATSGTNLRHESSSSGSASGRARSRPPSMYASIAGSSASAGAVIHQGNMGLPVDMASMRGSNSGLRAAISTTHSGRSTPGTPMTPTSTTHDLPPSTSPTILTGSNPIISSASQSHSSKSSTESPPGHPRSREPSREMKMGLGLTDADGSAPNALAERLQRLHVDAPSHPSIPPTGESSIAMSRGETAISASAPVAPSLRQLRMEDDDVYGDADAAEHSTPRARQASSSARSSSSALWNASALGQAPASGDGSPRDWTGGEESAAGRLFAKRLVESLESPDASDATDADVQSTPTRSAFALHSALSTSGSSSASDPTLSRSSTLNATNNLTAGVFSHLGAFPMRSYSSSTDAHEQALSDMCPADLPHVSEGNDVRPAFVRPGLHSTVSNSSVLSSVDDDGGTTTETDDTEEDEEEEETLAEEDDDDDEDEVDEEEEDDDEDDDDRDDRALEALDLEGY